MCSQQQTQFRLQVSVIYRVHVHLFSFSYLKVLFSMSFIICKGQFPPTIAIDIPKTMRTAIPIPPQSEWLLIPTTNPAITDDKIGIHTKRASRPRICAARNKTRSPPIISNIIILAELLFSRMCPILSSILTNNSQLTAIFASVNIFRTDITYRIPIHILIFAG